MQGALVTEFDRVEGALATERLVRAFRHDGARRVFVVHGASGQRVADDGLLGCNDCGKPLYYCTSDEDYHHVDREASCFLVPDDSDESRSWELEQLVS